MKKAGGNWVSGERFFNREVELSALTKRVENGTHTLLTGQRRIGKTSLVRELLRRLAETGRFETVFVDLEGARNAEDAIAELDAGLRSMKGKRERSAVARLRGFAERFEEAGIGPLRLKMRAGIDPENWRREGERVFKAFADCDRPVVLAIDELPILVNRLLKGDDYRITTERKEAADLFLSFLRKNGQNHKGDICMIVSGSVGLQPILRQAGLSAHANIFSSYELKPWSEETAAACLTALAESYEVDFAEGVAHEICDRLRCCVPHHVQQFFDALHEYLGRHERSQAVLDDIVHVYRHDMLGSVGQIDLDHYEQRLKKTLGESDYRMAFELLTGAAVSGGMISDESVQRHRDYFSSLQNGSSTPTSGVMDVLLHDGYLARQPGGGYRFASGLLEDWWRARHGGGFVPACER